MANQRTISATYLNGTTTETVQACKLNYGRKQITKKHLGTTFLSEILVTIGLVYSNQNITTQETDTIQHTGLTGR